MPGIGADGATVSRMTDTATARRTRAPASTGTSPRSSPTPTPPQRRCRAPWPTARLPRPLPRPRRRARRRAARRGARRARGARQPALAHRLLRRPAPLGQRLGRGRARPQRRRRAGDGRGPERAPLLRARVARARRRRGPTRSPTTPRWRATATTSRACGASRPHTRSEAEEEMLAEREPAAIGAWHTLFDQVTSSLQIPFEGRDRTHRRDCSRSCATTAPRAPHRGLRRALRGARAAHARAGPRVRLARRRPPGDGPRARLRRPARGRATWRNELPPAAVDAMLAASSDAYPLAHRWWRRKAQLLGLDQLYLADQYAPLGEGRRFELGRGHRHRERRASAASTRASSGSRASCCAEGRMDAEPRQGKRGGAFCASVAQDARPFILMNFTEKLDDVMTLAHELGHGMNFELSGERQTALSHHPPLALAEVPSTFAELIVFDRLLERGARPRHAPALIAQRIEGSFATIFRQTLMVRYEQSAYGLRGAGQGAAARPPGRLLARRRTGPTTATPSSCRRATATAGRTSRTSSTRASTPTPTCSRCWSCRAYGRYRADRDGFAGPTSSSSRGRVGLAGRAARRWASTSSPTPGMRASPRSSA